jgi:hypothetical protein
LKEASSLVTKAADRLWKPEGRQARAYLHGRRLNDETIPAARLGWTSGVKAPYGNGDKAMRCRGIVIPWFERDRLALVKIRDPDAPKDKRYKEAYRDRPGLYPDPGAICQGLALIITEGELDALLLRQELRDLAAVVTLGSASSRPDTGTRARMLAAPVWFLAHDADEAGDKGASGWPARARRVRPPEPFNDWTEAAQAGVNLRCRWLPRIGGAEALWHELAGRRWGPARGDETEAAHVDPYALAERQAIEQEQGDGS